MVYYAAIALGIIALVLGGVFMAGVGGQHHTLPYIAFVVGALLVIAGVVGMFVMKPKSI